MVKMYSCAGEAFFYAIVGRRWEGRRWTLISVLLASDNKLSFAEPGRTFEHSADGWIKENAREIC